MVLLLRDCYLLCLSSLEIKSKTKKGGIVGELIGAAFNIASAISGENEQRKAEAAALNEYYKRQHREMLDQQYADVRHDLQETFTTNKIAMLKKYNKELKEYQQGKRATKPVKPKGIKNESKYMDDHRDWLLRVEEIFGGKKPQPDYFVDAPVNTEAWKQVSASLYNSGPKTAAQSKQLVQDVGGEYIDEAKKKHYESELKRWEEAEKQAGPEPQRKYGDLALNNEDEAVLDENEMKEAERKRREERQNRLLSVDDEDDEEGSGVHIRSKKITKRSLFKVPQHSGHFVYSGGFVFM